MDQSEMKNMEEWTKDDEALACSQGIMCDDKISVSALVQELAQLLVKMVQAGFYEEALRSHPAVVLYVSKINHFVDSGPWEFEAALRQCWKVGGEIVRREDEKKEEAADKDGY